jgi:hypothetical protein
MTLLDARQHDFARDRRRRIWITAIILLVLIGAWAAYHFRDYAERNIAANFFGALQKQDYQSAYGIWFHDPAWRQHPEKYSSYQYNDFYRDWGPGADCSLAPGDGNGVIVQVTVNSRAEHAYVWVQKSNKTLSFSPSEIQCGNWWGWLTE